MLCVNARFRRGPQTGVQRVASEILSRLTLPTTEICPAGPLNGVSGHLWEQAVLPLLCKGRPLWSPCNTGPIAYHNQVVTLHDASVFDHPEWYSSAFVRTYTAMWPLLARRCRQIVTVSEHARARLAAALRIPVTRIQVVKNGVSDRFTPLPSADIEEVAARYGVEPGRYFVTLSTLEPRKNLKLVLQAWEIAKAHFPQGMQLLLLGGSGGSHIFADGREPSQIPEGVALSGYVPDEDLPGLLGGACALLYPSRYEGFGLPVLEAMACGTPAVTTALTSLPEVGGDAVRYVDPDDPAELAGLIRELATNRTLREDLRDAGLERAKEFSWEAAAANMQSILKHEFKL